MALSAASLPSEILSSLRACSSAIEAEDSLYSAPADPGRHANAARLTATLFARRESEAALRSLFRDIDRLGLFSEASSSLASAFLDPACSRTAPLALSFWIEAGLRSVRSSPNPAWIEPVLAPSLWDRSAPAWREAILFSSERDLSARSVGAILAWSGSRSAPILPLASLASRCLELASAFGSLGSLEDGIFFGFKAAERFRASFSALGPAQAPVADTLPDGFWLGFLAETPSSGKSGSFALSLLLERSRSNPALIPDLSAISWLSFDRKAVEAVEAAFPGSSALAAALLSDGPSLAMGCAFYPGDLERPKGRWIAKAASQVASKPDPREAGDLIRSSPTGFSDLILLQSSLLEKQRLRKASKAQNPAPRTRKPRSGL